MRTWNTGLAVIVLAGALVACKKGKAPDSEPAEVPQAQATEVVEQPSSEPAPAEESADKEEKPKPSTTPKPTTTATTTAAATASPTAAPTATAALAPTTTAAPTATATASAAATAAPTATVAPTATATAAATSTAAPTATAVAATEPKPPKPKPSLFADDFSPTGDGKAATGTTSTTQKRNRTTQAPTRPGAKRK
jgi:hypothetical protein